jgi:DNA-binding MurR/RpiR family transcriptional regulator
MENIRKEINSLNNFPLTETQQQLVNYLLANIDEVEEALAD